MERRQREFCRKALLQSPLLKQRGHSGLKMTPAATRAGTEAQSSVRRNANNRSANPAAITTGHAMSELRGQRLITMAILLDIVY